MVNAKVYKKTKVVETALATVHIETEVYETKPVLVGEGPPKWLKNLDPSQPNTEAKRQTDQRHHLNILFQLGQQHQSNNGEEKSAGSDSSDEARSSEPANGSSVAAHRSTSTRHLDVSASDVSNQQLQLTEPEGAGRDAAETYLGISLRDISNKLFMTSMETLSRATDGVEETKEGEEDSNKDSMPSIVGFDIGKVLPKNLLESIPAISFYGSKSSDEAPLNDPVNGKAPLFTEEMREKQRQSIVPLDEIRILDPCEACNADLSAVEDSHCYLRQAQSDEMSCVTIPNMNENAES
mmetsp:Transcript_22551/g.55819  ORF Transcript_22551/g.55819 Transcript_22551/m.55819 type:complete len:295 (-) Transcript_22551:139-1023(-)